MTTLGLILATVLTMTSAAFAQKANLNAPQGGVFNYRLEAEPEGLHPIMSGDLYSTYVLTYGMDTLCSKDLNTWEQIPALAEKWEISKDGLSFTFFLRKDAFFHNDEPLTAEDVKFSLEAIRNPKHQALNMIPYFEGFTKIEVVDTHTIKFTAKEKYFKNLSTLCSLAVIPKSVYGDIAKSVKMQKEFVGAGPYKLEKYEKGQLITLVRFDKWHGKNSPQLKGFANFDKIQFRAVKDDNVMTERFKKGDLDYATFTKSDQYLTATGKPFNARFKSDKYLGFAVSNSMPKSYGYIGFNMKDPILADKNVRLAFAHLVNRVEMNKKFFESINDLATGPVPNKSTQAADMKAIEFSTSKAKDLLNKAGWADSDKNGVLDKVIDGQKTELRLSFIYARKESEKQWTIIKEDCKKAGIDIELKFLEWNSFIKNIDDRKMQLWAMGWGGGDVEMDPKQIWHSSSASKGGSNYGSYANAEVDTLIDEGRQELDTKKRTVIFKKAYTLIAQDVPYVFMYNNKYEFYLRSKKIASPTETFKYDFGLSTWWSAQK